MESKIKIRTAAMLSLIALALFSCAKRENAVLSQESLTDNGGLVIPPAPVGPRKLAIVTFDQVLQSMAAVTNTTPSTATRTYADANRTSFSLNGKVSDLTSGMWMAITTLAGHVCRDLYDQESARSADQRFYYKGVNLQGGDFGSVKTQIIGRLALAAWSRSPSSSESTEFDTALSGAGLSAGTLSNTQTRDALLIICTGVMASLAAQVR